MMLAGDNETAKLIEKNKELSMIAHELTKRATAVSKIAEARGTVANHKYATEAHGMAARAWRAAKNISQAEHHEMLEHRHYERSIR